MKATKIFFVILISFIIVTLLINQPWQKKRSVLSVSLPGIDTTIQLWEKPQWFFSTEYETWFSVLKKSKDVKWYLIDKQYITFGKVYVFFSDDSKIVRIETTGDSQVPHLICEYNIEKNLFKARSERTVLNIKGWKLLAQKKVR